MTLITPRARLLRALFEMTQSGESIEIFTLSEEAGLSVYGALSTLTDLEERGLVNARRLTLTLAGLATAAALGDGEHTQAVEDLARCPTLGTAKNGTQRVA